MELVSALWMHQAISASKFACSVSSLWKSSSFRKSGILSHLTAQLEHCFRWEAWSSWPLSSSGPAEPQLILWSSDLSHSIAFISSHIRKLLESGSSCWAGIGPDRFLFPWCLAQHRVGRQQSIRAGWMNEKMSFSEMLHSICDLNLHFIPNDSY